MLGQDVAVGCSAKWSQGDFRVAFLVHLRGCGHREVEEVGTKFDLVFPQST